MPGNVTLLLTAFPWLWSDRVETEVLTVACRPYNISRSAHRLTSFTPAFLSAWPSLPPWCSSNAPGIVTSCSLCACSLFYLKTLFPYSFIQLASLLPSGLHSNVTFPVKPFLRDVTLYPHFLLSICLHTLIAI